MTDTMLLVGSLVEGDPGRDAIHVAVVPVTSNNVEALIPATRVKWAHERSGTHVVHAGHDEDSIGVVDPYLRQAVFKGDKFWLFLYPASITSLKHRWAHPSFPDETEERKTDSRKWMEEFAQSEGCGFDDIMARAAAYVGHHYANRPADGYYPSDNVDVPQEFWDHYEKITGKRVPQGDRADYFSCTC